MFLFRVMVVPAPSSSMPATHLLYSKHQIDFLFLPVHPLRWNLLSWSLSYCTYDCQVFIKLLMQKEPPSIILEGLVYKYRVCQASDIMHCTHVHAKSIDLGRQVLIDTVPLQTLIPVWGQWSVVCGKIAQGNTCVWLCLAARGWHQSGDVQMSSHLIISLSIFQAQNCVWGRTFSADLLQLCYLFICVVSLWCWEQQVKYTHFWTEITSCYQQLFVIGHLSDRIMWGEDIENIAEIILHYFEIKSFVKILWKFPSYHKSYLADRHAPALSRSPVYL